jgi:hypothetical protein
VSGPSRRTSVDSGGGDMVGVSVGGSYNYVVGTKTVTHAPSDAPVTVDQVMERLAELERAVQGAELPAQLRDDALADVRTAREALARPTPGVDRARNTLQGTAAELEGSRSRIESATTMIPLVTAVLDMLGKLAG